MRTEHILDKRFIFVVGSPRSGTTWLHRMLGEHPAVAAHTEEITLFSKYLAPAVRHFDAEAGAIAAGGSRQGLPLLFSQAEFDDALHRIIEATYQRVLELRPAATHIADKHPYYAQHLPLIDRLLPQCKVVHIVRDGRAVAYSSVDTYERLGFGAPSMGAAARVWRNCVRRARAHGEHMGPDRYLEMRYEDLQANTTELLGQVMRFCGLHAPPELVERIAHAHAIERRQHAGGQRRSAENVPAWRSGMKLPDRILVDSNAGAMLCRLGYAQPGWWAYRWTDHPRAWVWIVLRRARAAVRALRAPLRALEP